LDLIRSGLSDLGSGEYLSRIKMAVITKTEYRWQRTLFGGSNEGELVRDPAVLLVKFSGESDCPSFELVQVGNTLPQRYCVFDNTVRWTFYIKAKSKSRMDHLLLRSDVVAAKDEVRSD